MWTHLFSQHFTRFAIEGSELEILNWSYSECLPSNVPHRHTYFEACLVGQHGEGRFEVDGQTYPLRPRTFFLARPGQVHQIINTASLNMELYWVSLIFKRMGGGEAGRLFGAFKNSMVSVVPEEASLLSLWKAAIGCAQDSVVLSGRTLLLRSMLQTLLLGIAEAGIEKTVLPVSAEPCGTRVSYQKQLAQLGVLYVHDNLDRPLPVEEVARFIGISKRQISRLFSDHTGVSPATYIERARMDRAEGLLRHGQGSVKQVANAVGYRDIHHFTRVFTRVVGTPPAHYRELGGPVTPKPSGPNIPKIGSLV